MASPNLFIFRQALERGIVHSSRFSETPIAIGNFESDEQRYKVDVVDMKLIKEMQRRPSPWEKDKRMRPVEQRTER